MAKPPSISCWRSWLPTLLFIGPSLFLFFLPLRPLAGGAVPAAAMSGLLLPVQREIEREKGNMPILKLKPAAGK